MNWIVQLHPSFVEEFEGFSVAVQDELLKKLEVLGSFGPALGRPKVDTLKGSKHSNMKELRFDADNGVWRAAFAFDPERQAIVLVAGDKARANQKRFYRDLLRKADARLDDHLRRLKEERQ